MPTFVLKDMIHECSHVSQGWEVPMTQCPFLFSGGADKQKDRAGLSRILVGYSSRKKRNTKQRRSLTPPFFQVSPEYVFIRRFFSNLPSLTSLKIILKNLIIET